MTPRLAIACTATGALTLLALLVATGACTRIDQYAVDHLMLGLYPYVAGIHWAGGVPMAGRLAAPLASSMNPNRIVNRIADAAYIPAGGVIATALVGLAALAAAARRRPVVEIACWLAAYVVGNLLELVGKWTITRPALHTTPAYGSLQVWKFDTSFPSGHTIRACILAAFVAWAVPYLRAPAAIWAAAVVVLLVLAGTHTPTDVIGGLLAALALVLFSREVGARLAARGVAV